MFSCQCSLGPNRVSILPPTAIRAWDMNENGRAEAVRPPGSSPLLVFVNSKSGDNQVNFTAMQTVLLSIVCCLSLCIHTCQSTVYILHD